jgi:hypothetical protein
LCGLQIQGLAACVNVAGGNTDNKRALAGAGVCREIMWAMQAFPNDRDVQLQGQTHACSVGASASRAESHIVRYAGSVLGGQEHELGHGRA